MRKGYLCPKIPSRMLLVFDSPGCLNLAFRGLMSEREVRCGCAAAISRHRIRETLQIGLASEDRDIWT
jgi:hypothetical protein